MTDKTPEELAEEFCKGLELAQGFDSSKFAWPPAYFTKDELREGWLEGYHSRDAEIADLKKRLAKAEDPYGD